MFHKQMLCATLLALVATTPSLAKDLSFVGQDYPPFNWNDGGEIKGGMVDVLKKACEKLAYKCTFEIIPLARSIEMLREGHIDGVMSLIPNAERGAFARFSPTVVATNMSYFGARGKVKKIDSRADLDGWKVGAVRASTSWKLATQDQKLVTNMSLVEEVNNETLVKKLQAGRYGEKGAVLGSEAVLAFEAKKIGLELELVLRGETQGFTVAFSKKKGDAQTFADFSATLDAMKRSGELKSILTKYSLQTE